MKDVSVVRALFDVYRLHPVAPYVTCTGCRVTATHRPTCVVSVQALTSSIAVGIC